MDDMVLVHHGVDGQKWGNRKYQYEDGSLTPLGRIHYGVGEARDRAKIKMRETRVAARAEAKIIKAKSKAEVAKLKAESKAYKEKQKADNEIEREKLKNERERDKDINRENQAAIKAEKKANEDLANATRRAQIEESKSSKAMKTLLGVAALAGVGYLIYKGVSASGPQGVSTQTVEKGKEFTKSFSKQPVKGPKINNATKAAEGFTYKGGPIKRLVDLATDAKGDYNKLVAKGISPAEALKIVGHSDMTVEELYHKGIDYQKADILDKEI